MLQKFIKLSRLPQSIVKKVAFFPYESGIILNSIDKFTARWLVRNIHAIKKAMKELGIYNVTIAIRGQTYWPISIDKDPTLKMKYEVSAMAINTEDLIDLDLDSLDLSRPDLILTELYQLKYPVYITCLGREETVFYNQADVLQMPDIPLSKLVNATQALTYPDELANRNRLLRSDGHLQDYIFKGMRWYNDGENLLRKEMSFVANYSLCEYMGQPARLGIFKHEEELRKFVD